MESDTEDEDLKRAIALSLQEQSGLNSREIVDLDSDTEGDTTSVSPIRKLLVSPTKDTKVIKENETEIESNAFSSTNARPTTMMGISGLDRKQMEADRIARLKRKRGNSNPPSVMQPVRDAIDSYAQRKGFSSISNGVKAVGSSVTRAGTPPHAKRPSYPHGVVRKTHAVGYEKTPDVITLDEVLEPEDLQMAVLSSFQWDMPWLLAKLTCSKPLVMLVIQAKDEATKQHYRHQTAKNPRLRVCFPPMDGGVGCMHSKLMLLSHPGYLRVVVPTANLVSYDWGETGMMENMVFLIDLPRITGEEFDRSGPGATDNPSSDKQTSFQEELFYFCQSMSLERSIINSLRKFDFSATKDIAFVHTIAGSHSGPEKPWRRTGHCGLAQAVERLGLKTNACVDINYVTSSLGSLKTDFLDIIYRACQGQMSGADDDEDTSRSRSKSQSKTKIPKSILPIPSPSKPDLDSNFHILFPTHSTVTSSRAGGAGTICLQERWYDAPTFPRRLLRDCISLRCGSSNSGSIGGLLMHNKLMLVSRRPPPTAPVHPEGSNAAESFSSCGLSSSSSSSWAYIGSHNLSESAWGNKLTCERGSTRARKMYARNWECGVILRMRTSNTSANVNANVNVNVGYDIPIPMRLPAPAYERGERPWFFEAGGPLR